MTETELEELPEGHEPQPAVDSPFEGELEATMTSCVNCGTEFTSMTIDGKPVKLCPFCSEADDG